MTTKISLKKKIWSVNSYLLYFNNKWNFVNYKPEGSQKISMKNFFIVQDLSLGLNLEYETTKIASLRNYCTLTY